MAYFGGAGRLAGDPGLFDTLRKVGRSAFSFIPGGSAVQAEFDFFRSPRGPAAIPRIPRGGGGITVGADGVARSRRRKMNVTNVKALKRAMRRTDGFVKVAKKALKGSNFEVVSRASQATARAKASVLKAQATRHHAR